MARQTDEEFRNEQTLATMQSANEAAKRAEEARRRAEEIRQGRGK
ncbi:hypothetical protein [Streptomyces antimycoticus]|nr:hypothetical protein OG751_04175 [Streptomyces antimycoticus]